MKKKLNEWDAGGEQRQRENGKKGVGKYKMRVLSEGCKK